MTKKILYLRTDITYQELVAGGAVSHTVGVINGFIDLGIEVVVAAASMLQVLKKQSGLTLHTMQNPAWLRPLKWRINCLLSNVFFTLQAHALCKKNKFHTIYQRYSPLNFSGVLLSKWHKIPLILEYNGSEVWMDCQWSKKRRVHGIALMAWVERYNLKHAHTIVVVSDALKAELVERGVAAEKILVNPNGVNEHDFDPEALYASRQRVRHELALTNKFVVGFVGTFAPWHGIDTLQEMIVQLTRTDKTVHFIVIGDGPLLAPLKKTLQDHAITAVTCTGLLPHAVTKEYMSACDLFVSPTKPNADGSRFFGSPTKLFEYMSLAKPVVVSDLEQLAQIVNPAIQTVSEDQIKNKVGITVTPGDATGFAQAITAMIQAQPAVRTQLGANARAKVLAEYTWQKHVQKIVEFDACI